MEQDQTIMEGPILSIPTELMVIVISFLSSRDRVKLRYVSPYGVDTIYFTTGLETEVTHVTSLYKFPM